MKVGALWSPRLLRPLGCWLPKDRVGVGTKWSGLSGGLGWDGPVGVGEVAEADDTGTDSSLAGRETTDWPGHRRRRSWVLHSPGREPDSGRVRSLSGQLFSSRASVRSPQGGRRGIGV